MTIIPYSEYSDATELYLGWCTNCKEFTTECCEPDATEYPCDVCEKSTVYGAEQALLVGLFIILEDKENE